MYEKTELYVNLGKVIKNRRLKKGLTQGELAKLAAIPENDLNDIEKGLLDLTYDTVAFIAIALDTLPSSILKEMEEEYFN